MAEWRQRGLTIEGVPDSAAREAIAWLEEASTSPSSPGRDLHLLQATEKNDRLGMLGIEFVPGGTAWLVGPRIASQGSSADEIARKLLQAADELLRQHQVRLGQVLLRKDQQLESDWYRGSGYNTVISLDLLVRSVKSPDTAARPRSPVGLKWVEYSQRSHARFLRTLEVSYLFSQDCPELFGLRDLEDILAGHRAGGPFHPDLWQLLRLSGEDAGCLLLREQPEAEELEIVYLGLAPHFRGKGLGRFATEHALQQARRLGYPRVTLAVDAKNAAAQRLYAQIGFVCFSSKRVQICVFPRPS
jgi:ribosomal protein S18 acetylase RimI-like enzyme